MDNVKITYYSEYANKEVYYDLDGGFVYFLSKNGTWKYVAAPSKIVLGITTGNSTYIFDYDSKASVFAYEIALFKEINIDNETFKKAFVVDTDQPTFKGIKNKSVSQSQDLINTIISNNQQILINNLVCARIIKLSEKNGKTLPKEVYNNIFSLQVRLQNRNKKLVDNSWLSGVQESKHEYFSKYAGDLNSCVNDPRIGVIISVSLATVVIVSAILSIIITSLIWYYFSDDADESKRDYEYSSEFIDLLKKLSPEECALAEKEVQDAYDEGFKLGKSEGGKWTTLLKTGSVFMGLYLVNNLIQKKQFYGFTKS